MKDANFLGLVKIRITNEHCRANPDEPTLFEWAGIKAGDEFLAEYYSDGELWTRVKADFYSEEFGQVLNGDWFSVTENEAEIVE